MAVRPAPVTASEADARSLRTRELGHRPGERVPILHAVTNDGQRLLIWAGHTNLRSARATAVGFAKEGIGRHVRETERFRNSALDDNAVITEIELSAPAR